MRDHVRNPGLDVVRTLAIAGVLVGHAGLLIVGPNVDLPDVSGWALTSLGVFGVELFFVLSGFLIGGILCRMAQSSRFGLPQARLFWIRRWFRTLPNYTLFLLVNYFLAAVAVHPNPASPLHVFFLQNLAWPNPDFFGESWSVAVEEWFYLLLPLVLLAVPLRRPAAKVAVAATVLLLFAMVARTMAAWSGSFSAAEASDLRSIVLMRLDALSVGVLAAVAAYWSPATWQRMARPALAALGATCAAAGVALEMLLFQGQLSGSQVPWAATLAFPLMTWGTMLAFPWFSTLGMGRRAAGVFARCSDLAYSLYLAHIPVLLLLMRSTPPEAKQDPWSLIAIVAAYFVLSVAVAAAVFFGFERKVTRLRERWSPRVEADPLARTASGPSVP